jgi:ribosome-binding factor A
MGSLIREELGKLLERDFDFNGALVTVIDVSVDEKFEYAVVKLGILPFEKGPEAYKMIEDRKRELQSRLLRKMNVKPMPRLVFRIAEE